MLGISAGITAYLIVLAFIIGTCVGSFVNCAAWRMVHGESVLKGRSHCPACDHQLAARDLIPLFSWLFQKGRCRYCGERISPRYPIVELVSAIVFVSLLLEFDVSITLLEMFILFGVLICLSLTDLDEQRIPNVLIIIGIVDNLVFAVLRDVFAGLGWFPILVDLGLSVLGGVIIAVPLLVIALIMDKVLGRESMGGGDLKLFFMVGMYLTWRQDILLIIIACIIGIVFACINMARRSHDSDGHEFPFGPAISIATWIVMLCGTPILTWYIGLF